ncbi:Serine/threonine-protein phosphatase 6 regulatory subunit 3-A,Serine/threonine-protein phosphatase 6 regulatory subunit 3-B,Serine/threonine-protein phosphatase 6 regulatory subunit 3,Serine/threonine-protein phosphatase 6 regulatory subunit 1,Serine/threonine-protein phosphatase 6 regulatory subunit 2 [Acanthosepion pharaonis]|uniref:Serine/threonine-protein phosphatase 6 regulatory subunit 3 n=1 Tax=Acanthosepion pharaonis TaxID=158019 RepID=A0A812DSU7_ACAPH|nr:Serine/threonine-protein phosphatase 6 regulatory subunit 3-A,Serine/threonine-protein phosphatase 6 regulatory subunit 3-B,Serine/threonine-protein phosphatase 6 regulatory subunit 3,Serine/threonine-protein phosphatase 6 regulatory subunit 1,Serine/threonine-protein phosphatase 6 regulatory subunit 2 [Sepia pharaonis]
MFWKFNLLSSTHIDTILEREDVTLQELLDEDDILQECKARHKKLIDFLIRPDNLGEMVNMVTQEPSEDIEEKLRYRYPNTSCEVLTCDVTQINDRLAGDDTYINKLYSFLGSKGPLNPLLASFVSKVMGLLIARKSEMIFEFLKSKSDFVGTLLIHIGTSAMMDLLLRLITCIESPELRVEMIQWLNEQRLVERLVDQVVPTIDEDVHTNAAQSLCDIVRIGREQMSQLQDKAESDPLLVTVECESTVCRLLYNILDGEKNESVIVNGLLVIQTLLDVKKQGFEGELDQRTPLDMERLTQGINNVLSAIAPRIKDFHSLLQNPPKPRYCAMPTTIGVLEPPLGNTRLQIAKLITALIQTNSHSVNVELANSGTIGVLLDLYFKYIWNNFLHSQVEQCISLILNNSPSEVEDRKEHPLLQQIFIKCNLIQRILDSWEENDQYENRVGGRRRGYMGHLTKIANHIAECLEKGENSELLKDQMKEIPEEYRNKWESFVSSTLAEINKKNTVKLVQGHPLQSSSEDDDADFSDLSFTQDSVMQQAFSDYQLQQMTTNFIDTFGFNEHEFADHEGKIDATFTDKISSIDFNIRADEDGAPNATMFEQACNERIQQFDDNDSDEEIWEKKEVILYENSPVRQPGLSGDSLGSHDHEEEDDNTDSDEELDSPKRIVQQPQEKMDVDGTETWTATFDEVPIETNPVAMETSPWDTAPVTTASPEQKWANFEMSGNTWADFSSFNSSMERLPRSSSPVAMETGDISSSNFGSSGDGSQSSPLNRTGETAGKKEVEKSTKDSKSKDISWSHEDSKEVSTKETADQPSNLPESGEQNSTDAKLENCKTQDQVNCLPKGYSFLSSVGLIKPGVTEEPAAATPTTASTTAQTTSTCMTAITTSAASSSIAASTSDSAAAAVTNSIAPTAAAGGESVGASADAENKFQPATAAGDANNDKSTSSTDNSNPSSKANLIEDVRSQAKEAMEKYEKAITASMKNGPI